MNPSKTDTDAQDKQPRKRPQIGRREIGVFLLLLAINSLSVFLFHGAASRQRVAIPYSPTFLAQVKAGVAGIRTAPDATPPAEPALAGHEGR